MLHYLVYEKGENSAVLNEEYKFETTDADSLNEIKDLSKDKNFWVSPMTEDSAAVLFQRARKKTNWTQDMVTFAHKHYLKGLSAVKIQMEIYVNFETVVTVDSVHKTLRQESNTEFSLEEGLREKVAATVPEKSKRGSTGRMTPELEAEIHAAFDAGMTGKEVGEKFGFSDSHVNSIRRKKVGYRVRGRKAAEPKATPIGVVGETA